MSTDYFSGRHFKVFILGFVLLVVLTFTVPAPERWKHTVGTALVWGAAAPWMLTTIFSRKVGAYLLCSLVAVVIMAAIEAMFR